MKAKVVSYGIFVALAMMFSYIESLLPIYLGIPGAKLGLANLVIVTALYKWDAKTAYLLSITRVVLTGFLFGNFFSIIYSLAGGLISLSVMIPVKKSNRFSIVGVSVCGGVFHNVGQMAVAMCLIETYSVIYYAPVLLLLGTITGLCIGLAANEILKRLVNIEF